MTASDQEAAGPSDLFSSSPLDKGTKGRTKTVLSLFDEEEDKVEDQSNTHVSKNDAEKVSKEEPRGDEGIPFQTDLAEEIMLFSTSVDDSLLSDAGSQSHQWLAP